jgi:outer membrane protein assembly factor BamB
MNIKIQTYIKYFFIIPMLLLLCGCFDLLPYSRPSYTRPPDRQEMPKIAKSDVELMKTKFFQDNYMKNVSDIAYGELDPIDGHEIGVAGRGVVFFLDRDGKIKKRIELKFDNTMGMRNMIQLTGINLSFIDSDNDNISEYLIRGSMGQPPSLYNHDGEMLWMYYPDLGQYYFDIADAGDVDGDGVLEYAVAYSSQKTIHLLDNDGNKIWSKTIEHVDYLEMKDIDQDGNDEIIVSDYIGKITVLESDGSKGRSINTGNSRDDLSRYDLSVNGFTFLRWPDKSSDLRILTKNDQGLKICDFDGNILASFGVGDTGLMMNRLEATTVKFKEDQPEYIAVVIYAPYPRDRKLIVIDSNGKLVHDEMFSSDIYSMDSSISIATLPSPDNSTEVLLCGVDNTVWKYEIQDDSKTESVADTSMDKPQLSEPVDFPDRAFEAAIRRAVAKPDSEITIGDMESITALQVSGLSGPTITDLKKGTPPEPIPISDVKPAHTQITNLEGIQYCANLKYLQVDKHRIVDLTPLSNLKELSKIDLSSNQVADITPLLELNNLQWLDLSNNKISTLGGMKGVYNIRFLNLNKNNISDISNLADLEAVTIIVLNNNSIKDLSPLAKLANLQELKVTSNNIDDISTLGNMKDLCLLDASDNNIDAFGDLINMTNLKWLSVSGNKFSDLSSVTNLPPIRSLILSNNQISDISPLKNITFGEDKGGPYTNQDYRFTTYPRMPGMARSVYYKQIVLENNHITDISPLIEIEGLGERVYFFIKRNPLDMHIANRIKSELESLGVIIHIDQDEEK